MATVIRSSLPYLYLERDGAALGVDGLEQRAHLAVGVVEVVRLLFWGCLGV